jgi:hypothetical protein
MSFEPRDYLLHILAEADFLLEASEGLTFSGVRLGRDAPESIRSEPRGDRGGVEEGPADFS